MMVSTWINPSLSVLNVRKNVLNVLILKIIVLSAMKIEMEFQTVSAKSIIMKIILIKIVLK